VSYVYILQPIQRDHYARYLIRMTDEENKQPTQQQSSRQRHEKLRLCEDDIELEREFRMLAQLMIETHLAKHQGQRARPQDRIDRIS